MPPRSFTTPPIETRCALLELLRGGLLLFEVFGCFVVNGVCCWGCNIVVTVLFLLCLLLLLNEFKVT